MLSNAVSQYGIEMSFIFRRILGPLVFGWAPNNFALGAQLAPSEKMLSCIPGIHVPPTKEEGDHIVFGVDSIVVTLETKQTNSTVRAKQNGWKDGLASNLFNSITGLLLRVHNRKIIFLSLNQNICCVYSKEPSH